MIKAVIFDMFETLITHFESPVYMGKQISNDIGIAEQKFREIWDTTDDDRTLGKRTLEEVIEEVLRVNNCFSTELFERIITKRKASKKECFAHIHPEIIPLFVSLKELKIKIGLITNCYFEERDVIKDSIFFDYFDAVCMSCEVGLKKPDIGIFQKCMNELEVLPEECLYIGDGGSFELETAQSLGMHPLQATWYLKDGVNQPAKRKAEFLQAVSPLHVIFEVNKYMNYEIIRLTDKPEMKDQMAGWFHEKWGVPLEAYLESMNECLSENSAVPQWYAAIEDSRIIGGLGVIENDFHDRKDLTPNVCAVYTEPDKRCSGVAGALLNYVCSDMKIRGIETLYLVTDHTSFYERYGWKFLCMVQGDGEPDMSRMYIHRM